MECYDDEEYGIYIDPEEQDNAQSITSATPIVTFLTRKVKEIGIILNEKYTKQGLDAKKGYKNKSEGDWGKEVNTAETLKTGLENLLKTYMDSCESSHFVPNIKELVTKVAKDPKCSFEKNNKAVLHKPTSKLSDFAVALKKEAVALEKRHNLNPSIELSSESEDELVIHDPSEDKKNCFMM